MLKLNNILLIILFCGSMQSSKYKMELEKAELDAFPQNLKISNKVFQYYFQIGFQNGQLLSLNNSQKGLCYYFICEGMIDNSGLMSILLETQGLYTSGYIEILSELDELESINILEDIDSIYKKHEPDFSIGNTPIELDAESPKHDPNLLREILNLEKRWFILTNSREEKMLAFLMKNKNRLVKEK